MHVGLVAAALSEAVRCSASRVRRARRHLRRRPCAVLALMRTPGWSVGVGQQAGRAHKTRRPLLQRSELQAWTAPSHIDVHTLSTATDGWEALNARYPRACSPGCLFRALTLRTAPRSHKERDRGSRRQGNTRSTSRRATWRRFACWCCTASALIDRPNLALSSVPCSVPTGPRPRASADMTAQQACSASYLALYAVACRRLAAERLHATRPSRCWRCAPRSQQNTARDPPAASELGDDTRCRAGRRACCAFAHS